jgi:hypothetical protein
MIRRSRNLAPAVLAVLGSLLFVDLFFDWGGSAGWDALTGPAAIALVLLEVIELAAHTPPPVRHVLVAVVLLAVVTFGSTAAAFLDRSSPDWPAYVGLVIASAILVAALGRATVLGGLEQRESGAMTRHVGTVKRTMSH